VLPQPSLQPVRQYFFVCLADHDLPHPLPDPPLEGEGTFNFILAL
jgi:hypothetical protein